MKICEVVCLILSIVLVKAIDDNQHRSHIILPGNGRHLLFYCCIIYAINISVL
jgi:hypothetical protein